MESQGWRLFVHPLFEAQLQKLTKRAGRLASNDPRGYASHPAANELQNRDLSLDRKEAAFATGCPVPEGRHS
jgi:hypothetical protein